MVWMQSDQDTLNGREEGEESEQRKCLAQGSGSHHAGHQVQHDHVKYCIHTSIELTQQLRDRLCTLRKIKVNYLNTYRKP